MSNFLIFCFFAWGLIHCCKGIICPNGVFLIKPLECPDTCDNIYLKKDCDEAKKLSTHCRCNTGYILSKDGVCQTLESCRKSKCGQNAIFRKSPCSKSCLDHLNNQACIIGSIPGCACLEGYYIGKNGTCVSESQCIKENVCYNGIYESKPCSKTCKNMFTSNDCSISLRPGCKCKEGYFLNSKGACVLPKDCDEVNCVDTNSEFEPTSCVKTCRDHLYNEPCTPSEVPKCACKPGFVLNGQGVCISEMECEREDPCRSRNGVISMKPCNIKCENLFSFMNCIISSTPGCQCNDGYYQTSNGNCVKAESCTGVKCEDNSAFNASSCEHTCKTFLFGEECIKIEQPLCACNDGYYRNSRGECVSAETCKHDEGICPESSSFQEKPCNKKCLDMFDGQTCIPEASPGCQCDNGLFKNKQGECVNDTECDEVLCKPHSEFTSLGCEHTCKKHLFGQTCHPYEGPICSCKDGYYRNSFSECVTEESCKSDVDICSENSEYAEEPCSKTCENMFFGDCTSESSRGCQCKEGHFKNMRGDCVKADKCDKVRCKEKFEFKPSSCVHTCKSFLFSEECIPNPQPACVCKHGFYLDSNGDCISESSCRHDEDVCPKHSSFQDKPCSKTCLNMFSDNRCIPESSPGCQCDQGYFKNKDRICVKDNDCDEVNCNPNSIFTITSCEHTCKSHLFEEQCHQQVVPKCSCDEGYYRNSKGDCDSEENCKLDSGVCPENSEYTEQPCSETCENMFIGSCTPESSPGCRCKNGYFKNMRGDCVKKDQCDRVRCKPNSSFNPTSCEHTCKTILFSKPCIPVTEPSCTCDDGFARNLSGDCVSKDSCKTEIGICPENSSYKENIECLKTCKNMFGFEGCTSQMSGCQCDDGYYMKKNGECVRKADCDEVECEDNSVFETTACEHNCKSFLFEDRCEDMSEPACYCSDGFSRNSSGKCVSEENCEVDEGICVEENTVFDKSSCEITCKNYLAEETCTAVPKRGCRCKDGYYRDNGVCISKEECSDREVDICPVFSVDRKHPRIQTCEDMFGEITYSEEPGCECIEEYFLNEKGECIPAGSCKNVKCPSNSIFKKTSCTLTCKNHLLGKKCTKCLIPQCACRPGFYLHSDGNCVSREECLNDPDVCEDNALFQEKPCSMSCLNMFTGAKCTPSSRPGCQCNDGFFSDRDRHCVAARECDFVKCSKNAYFDSCSAGNKKTCQNMYLNISEVEPQCIPECVCMDGTVMNSNGVCLLPEMCPALEIQCPSNLKYNKCGSRFHRICGHDLDVIDKRAPCIPGCYCDKDTYFDEKINACVALHECTNSLQNIACRSIDPLMTFEVCHDGPPKTCSNYIPEESSEPKCRPGCYCVDGYVLNKYNRCASVDDCP